MIEESYVSFETSKLLKEAGFDVPCKTYYEIEDGEVVRKDGVSKHDHNGFGDTICSRPTLALAARWLREVHKLHVWCETTPYGDWFCCISKIKPYEEYAVVSEAEYSSFEQALEAGLQKAIKLIKK